MSKYSQIPLPGAAAPVPAPMTKTSTNSKYYAIQDFGDTKAKTGAGPCLAYTASFVMLVLCACSLFMAYENNKDIAGLRSENERLREQLVIVQNISDKHTEELNVTFNTLSLQSTLIEQLESNTTNTTANITADISGLNNNLVQLKQMQDTTTSKIGVVNTEIVVINDRIEAVQSDVKRAVAKSCTLVCQHDGVPNDACSKCIKCNALYTGDLCELPRTCSDRCNSGDTTAVCSCANGGVVDQSTCTCNCVTGWTGDDCSTLDTNVNDEQRAAYIKDLFDKAKHVTAERQAQYETLLTLGEGVLPLQHHIGLGIVSGSGSLGAPVVKFEFKSNGTNTYTPDPSATFVVPDELIFNEMPEGLFWPEFASEAFPTFSDYISSQSGWKQDEMAEVGPHVIAGVSLDTLLTTYFGGDKFITVTQMLFPIYSTELPSNTAGHTFKYVLDDYFGAALDYLPKDCTTAECWKLYDTLLSFWGNTVIVKSLEGGVLQLLTTLRNRAFDYAGYNAELAAQDSKLLIQTYVPNLGGYMSETQAFTQSRVASAFFCAGGDAPSRGACQADIPSWTSTLWRSPMFIKYNTVPISRFVVDPVQKRTVQLAEKSFLAARKNDLSQGCPVCAHGTCTPPAKYCNCPARFTGRTCSSCIDGWVGPNCDVPEGITFHQCTSGQTLDLGAHRYCALSNELWCVRSTLQSDGSSCNVGSTMVNTCTNSTMPGDDNLGGCLYYGVYENSNGHWVCSVPSNAYGLNVVCED